MRTFYLLEGIPINVMAPRILKLKGYDMKTERARLGVIADITILSSCFFSLVYREIILSYFC
jgi:hypothetical protein